MNRNVIIPKDKISDFCQRHLILRLAVFGSALREDFAPDSDVDVLVEFEKVTSRILPFLIWRLNFPN